MSQGTCRVDMQRFNAFSLVFFGWDFFPLTLLYFLSIWACPEHNFQGSHFKDAVRVVQNSSSEAGAEWLHLRGVTYNPLKSPDSKLANIRLMVN